MAYADPALLKLAGLAGVTGANRAAQVVLGSDPEGGFHGRPRATAKTRSDLLKGMLPHGEGNSARVLPRRCMPLCCASVATRTAVLLS